jgi:hypothetical protein
MSDMASRPQEITRYANSRDEEGGRTTAGITGLREPIIEQDSGGESEGNGTASPGESEAEEHVAHDGQEGEKDLKQGLEREASASSRTPLMKASISLKCLRRTNL